MMEATYSHLKHVNT